MPIMIAGGALLALGILYAVVATVKRAEAYEYLSALFFAEWGAMLLVQNMFETDLARIGVIVFFAVSLAWTFVMWRKAHRRAFPGNGTSSSADRAPHRG